MPAWTLAILGSWIQEGREGFSEVTGLWSLSVIVPVLVVYRIMIRLQNSPGPVPCRRALAVLGPVRAFQGVTGLCWSFFWMLSGKQRMSHEICQSHHPDKGLLTILSQWHDMLTRSICGAISLVHEILVFLGPHFEHRCISMNGFAWVLRNSRKQAFKETVQEKEPWLGKAFWATSGSPRTGPLILLHPRVCVYGKPRAQQGSYY